MSNDKKQPAKTIMGWAPNTGPGQPQQPPWGQPAPQPPQPAAPEQGQWGAQPPQAPPQQQPPWGAQPPQPGFGAPPPGFGPGGPGGPPPGFGPGPGAPPPGFGPGPGGPGGPPPGFGGAPPQPGFGGPPPGGFGGPPPGGFGGPPPGFGPGGPGGPAPGFGGAPPQPGFGGPPPGGFGGPPPGGFGGPPPGGFGGAPPQQGYGGPPPQQPGFGGPPPGMQPAWGGPPPQAAAGLSFGGPPGESRRGIPGATATIGSSARLRFIRLTYLHLLGAILLFTALEYFFMGTEGGRKLTEPLVKFAFGVTGISQRANWGIVLGVFALVSFVANYMAEHTESRVLHYVGLGLYTLAEALIFVPLLTIVVYVTQDQIAAGKGDPNILRDAALITLGVFGALTASVFVTKKDFSFLRTALAVGGAAAAALIVLSLVFGFNLGIIFAVAMVLLCVGQILFKTSQIMAHDDPENYVGAALSLFASIALMFWYVLQILMKLRSND